MSQQNAHLVKIKKHLQQNNLDFNLYSLASYIQNTFPQVTEFGLWLSVLVQYEVSQGNVCIRVESIEEKSRALNWVTVPTENDFIPSMLASNIVGTDKDKMPLILDGHRLYLNRFYHNEKSIGDYLLLRTDKTEVSNTTKQQIQTLFDPSDEIDFQQLAIVNSLKQSLSIISGGPGTGKTWTVGKILEVLLQQDSSQPSIKIQLAAPTGKAAARLSESIQSLRKTMSVDEKTKQLIPQKAITLHRLLGIHRYTHRARYHQNNLLDCDVLVLDEASMIDQQMMAMICKAIPQNCKLILLGDKDQLSSVEAGSVFADLCGGLRQTSFSEAYCEDLRQNFDLQISAQQTHYKLADNVVVLHKSRRFDDTSGIGQLARLIKHGEVDASLDLLKHSQPLSGLNWQSVSAQDMLAQFRQQRDQTYNLMVSADSIQHAFEQFHQFQILCAVWAGPMGVDSMNTLIEQWIKAENHIDLTQEYYQGKPLIMMQNLHPFDIQNGDIGILWPDDQGQLRVWFQQSKTECRSLSLSQCPTHKTAYAITVHKSQGSEYEHVLMVLPETITPVSTRELLYTGITRAISSVEIWASEQILKASIQQKTERVSGLMQRLYGSETPKQS